MLDLVQVGGVCSLHRGGDSAVRGRAACAPGHRAGGGYTLDPAASRCPLHRAAVSGVTRHEADLHRGPLQPGQQSGGQRGHAGGGGALRRGGGEAEGGSAGEEAVDVDI